MKNIILCFFTLFFTLFSTHTVFADCGKIEGQWSMQEQTDDVLSTLTLSISDDSVIATKVCQKGEKSITVQAEVKSSYTDTTLTLLESQQDQKSSDDFDCEVSLNSETMSYSLLGNFLMLTNSQSKQLILIFN